MRGIDISSWQAGINLPACMNEIDFCIIKATGADSYVNPYCDTWVQECIAANKPWGFYHYANDGHYASAADEANFFLKNCWNYFGQGIPILDWEEDSVSVDWVNTFVNIIHSETGIWCWIYGNPWRFDQGYVEPNCGRWVASYPPIQEPPLHGDLPEPPYCDGLVCCWQFASDCLLDNYDGYVDADWFFGDEEAWAKYAGYWIDLPHEPEPEPEPQPDTHVMEDDDYKITIERK